MTIHVLFVCLGNICRSPTAQGVFEKLVANQQLSVKISTDSAGTSDWHIGGAPDKRSTAAAALRGYDLSKLQARQVMPDDFSKFDYILAMDSENLSNLQAMRPDNYTGVLGLFLDFLDGELGNKISEVPDPYYGDDDGFETVLNLIEKASHGLLVDIQNRHL